MIFLRVLNKLLAKLFTDHFPLPLLGILEAYSTFTVLYLGLSLLSIVTFTLGQDPVFVSGS